MTQRPRPPRRRYDPGTKPFPRHAEPSATPSGPTGNSRQQRRARARLSFAEQLALAKRMGFRIPDLPVVVPQYQQHWIAQWEAQYAAS